MTHHVTGGQGAEGDVLDAIENLGDLSQPAAHSTGKVDLGNVARHHHLGTESEPGEEHLHLLRGRVLSLVEDDEGVVQGAASHVGQGRHLNGAGGQEFRYRVGIHHVVQRIVKRSHVGIDLVIEGAWQET